MWQWWAFYCWMALIVGISIGKPWLLCRLLSLLKILALIQHWVYVVWCAEYCGVPICVMWWCSTKQAKLMDRILQICGIEWCMDMKEKADDLETFCERFRRLCWLDGPNRSISMLYLRLFDVRWFLKTWCYVCVFCFPITISVTYDCVPGFLFREACDHFVPGLGLSKVSCVRRMELIVGGVCE